MPCSLALLWSLRYGWDRVAVFSVPVPGLKPEMSQAELYRSSMDYFRQQVASDDRYHLVDLDEFLIVHKNWTHRLGGGAAEPNAAPDRGGMSRFQEPSSPSPRRC